MAKGLEQTSPKNTGKWPISTRKDPRKMQIKTTLKYHFTPNKMIINKKRKKERKKVEEEKKKGEEEEGEEEEKQSKKC